MSTYTSRVLVSKREKRRKEGRKTNDNPVLANCKTFCKLGAPRVSNFFLFCNAFKWSEGFPRKVNEGELIIRRGKIQRIVLSIPLNGVNRSANPSLVIMSAIWPIGFWSKNSVTKSCKRWESVYESRKRIREKWLYLLARTAEWDPTKSVCSPWRALHSIDQWPNKHA